MTFFENERKDIMRAEDEAYEVYEKVKEQLEKGDSAFFGNASRTLVQSAVPFFKKKGGIFIQKGEKADAAVCAVRFSGWKYISVFLFGKRECCF